MRSRTERYSENSHATKPRVTRTKRNEYLYDDMNNKIGLEVIDINSQNGINLSNFLREEEKEENVRPKAENISFTEDMEMKVFDVNSVLEEAKRNRIEVDELEKKRKLKNEEYNVLSNLNKKYITQKEKMHKELEEEGLEELINTITSNTLTKDIKDQELFGDLMATSVDIDVKEDGGDSSLDINKTEDGHLVNSFYTRSMDLTEEDFEMSDEFVEPSKKKKVVLILLVILVLLAIMATVGYFILKSKNII